MKRSKDAGRSTSLVPTMEGYQPLIKGYQPQAPASLGTAGKGKPQGGHQPTGQGGPSGPPPNQGTGGKPSK